MDKDECYEAMFKALEQFEEQSTGLQKTMLSVMIDEAGQHRNV